MPLSDTQILIALVVALVPGVLAFRLATELYK
ncbi:photosystem I reaction center subunit XII [Halothece sp. PCC 7418]|nr:photosystem I reaction center subunit XII [Halothece sp. PCC 7418]AFZ45791.1 photosystem I reaction center subunit XII [Halothece sp. PCC 7418]